VRHQRWILTRGKDVDASLIEALQPLRDLREIQAAGRVGRRFASIMNRLATDLSCVPEREGEAGFVVLPWPTFTLLPEYILALAIAFRMRGRNVRIIWDDTIFGAATIAERLQHRRIHNLLESMPSVLSTLRLSDFAPASEPALSEQEVDQLAELNGIRRFLCETPAPGTQAEYALFRESMTVAADRIQTLLLQHPLDYLVVPGGIYRTSGLFVGLGKRLGVRVATFDSGGPVLHISTDGVAAHHDDIPRVFGAIPDDDKMVEWGQAELARRMEGKDTFSYQTVTAEGRDAGGGVLIPLNQSFDTAALGRQRLFRSQTEWMLESVAWILEHTQERVVIRRHPVERRTGMHSRDDYEGSLAARFGTSPRIRYIRAEHPVNTYDLLRAASIVLPHTSTVGVEAAALGKPVVLHSDSYYANLGFVWSARSREEYFELIGRALTGDLCVSEKQRRAAWRCYYLTQCCSFLNTAFTPENIRGVMDGDLRVILRDGDLDLVFESIDGDHPLCLGMNQRAQVGFNQNADRRCTIPRANGHGYEGS